MTGASAHIGIQTLLTVHVVEENSHCINQDKRLAKQVIVLRNTLSLTFMMVCKMPQVSGIYSIGVQTLFDENIPEKVKLKRNSVIYLGDFQFQTCCKSLKYIYIFVCHKSAVRVVILFELHHKNVAILLKAFHR